MFRNTDSIYGAYTPEAINLGLERAHRQRALAFERAAAWIAGRLARGAAAMGRAPVRAVRAYRRWRLERESINELRNLSDRTLKDIGLHRADIPDVVRAIIAARSAARRPTARLTAVDAGTRVTESGDTPRRDEDMPDWKRAA